MSVRISSLFDQSKFSLDATAYERISCNLCNGTKTIVVSSKDRNDLPQKTVMCRQCGLLFLNPRMTKEWYNKFYETGFNRALIPLHWKATHSPPSPEIVFKQGEKFGTALAERIRPYVRAGFTIEVGSATGGILSSFKKVLTLPKVLGIEPAREEAEYARHRGIPTEICLFENFPQRKETPENILCVQSLNHILDPKAFFSWAHATLAPAGRLILVVQNFEILARKIGKFQYATQIDHTFMFTPRTFTNFITSAGFDRIFFENWEDEELVRKGLSTHHMCIVAEKTSRIPFQELSIPNHAFVLEYLAILRLKFRSFFFPLQGIKKGIFRNIKSILQLFSKNTD